MQVEKTECEGVLKITCFSAKDIRGGFTKVFSRSEYDSFGPLVDIKESYYSISSKNVIRGMHFQLPPHEHAKIVHVIKGRVKDVLLDLRRNSRSYGMTFEFILDESSPVALYIPVGIAHGFMSLEDDTMMLYQVTSEYDKESDTGILFSSIGYDWNNSNPIISERDQSFVELKDFRSPF